MWGSPHPLFPQILSQKPPETSFTDIHPQLLRGKNGLALATEITLPKFFSRPGKVPVVENAGDFADPELPVGGRVFVYRFLPCIFPGANLALKQDRDKRVIKLKSAKWKKKKEISKNVLLI